MTKIFKISIILFIALLLISTFSIATDINMNLTAEENLLGENIVNDNSDETVPGDVDDETIPGDTADEITDALSGTAAPSAVNSIAQENMSFSNVLNILIITVGVILILLAIAILIRLKG